MIRRHIYEEGVGTILLRESEDIYHRKIPHSLKSVSNVISQVRAEDKIGLGRR